MRSQARRYNQLSNKQLIELHNGGDKYAFLELYTRHIDKLIGFFRVCAGQRRLSNDVCKDLIQDTYISLLDSPTFQGNSIKCLGNYIMTIAFNTWSAYINEEKQRKKDKANWANSLIHEMIVHEEENEEKGKIIDLDFDRLLEPLNNKQKQAIRLRYQEGRRYKEIEKIMEISAKHSVRGLLQRGLENLRNFYLD